MMRTLALSRTILAVTLVIIIIAASITVVYGLHLSVGAKNNEGSVTTSNSASSSQEMISLAYQHWASIGEKNITAVMSQYSQQYEAVWFYINSTSIGPGNGRYDCNTPTGPYDCSQFLKLAWTALFNNTSWQSYSVCNITVTIGVAQRALLQATVWYQEPKQNATLKVPYEMDFRYQNNSWIVYRDWFGLPQEQATILYGFSTTALSQSYCKTFQITTTTTNSS